MFSSMQEIQYIINELFGSGNLEVQLALRISHVRPESPKSLWLASIGLFKRDDMCTTTSAA